MYINVVILKGTDLLFEKRSQQFQEGFQNLLKPDDAFGFLVTALPTNDDIQFDRVFHGRNIVPALDEKWHSVYATQHPNQSTRLVTFLENYDLPWRPRPRAVRANSDSFFWDRYSVSNPQKPITNLHKEINCNGLVEFGLMSSHFYAAPYVHYVSPHLLFATFANLIVQTHRVRLHADQPATPYTIKAMIHVKESPRTIGRPEVEYGGPLGTIDPGNITFPLYELKSVSDATEVLNLFHLDLYHLFGRSLDTEKYHLTIEDWNPDESFEHKER